MALLKTTKLTKLYAPNTGAQDVDIELDPGEIVGFIGPNGAGKSTTMEMIMQLIKVDRGEIEIFGTKIHTREDFRSLMDGIGYLPAEGGVYSYLTSREFLDYCGSFYKEWDKDRIYELADKIDLDLERKISELSSGNRKKAAFLSCLVNDPKLLILDEPTSSLDPLVQKVLLDRLEEISSSGGSVLLSSHVLSEVQSVCDRVYLIKDSRIILSENTTKLLGETLRKISVKNCSKKLIKEMSSISGIKDVISGKDHITFYSNNLKDITNILVKHQHFDYLVEQPSLEKMFMRYYQ